MAINGLQKGAGKMVKRQDKVSKVLGDSEIVALLAFTVCQSTCVPVSGMKKANIFGWTC